MLSRLNFCVNWLTPHASKNKRHKPYFLPHVVTVALSSSKIPTENTLATGHQDDNKNTYEANIVCSLTFKVSQKHAFFSHNTFATAIAETAAPNCPRTNFACTLLYTGRFLLTWPVTLRYQSLCSLVPAYLQGMSSHHILFNFLGFL